MDTTAAAELGGGVVDGGVGFWDTGGGAGEAEQQQQQGWGRGGGHNRPSGSTGPNMELPPKRMRNMNNGGGDGYGSGSGNFNNASSMAGFSPSDSDPGLRVGHGPGGAQGGSPGLKNNFPAGGPNLAYPQGPPPGPLPPGMPTGDQSAQGPGMPRGRGMGSIFYKTKLCSRFRSGNCPYNTNCNFAHGMDELRRPPPGWEDAAGALEGGGAAVGGGTGGNDGGAGGGGGENGGVGNRGGGGNGGPAGGTNANVAPSNPPGSSQGPDPGPNQGLNQGINQGPTPAGGNMNDLQRFHKTRPCKKYFSEMGCPYGDRCNFLHDETNPQIAPKPGRESVVVTVVGNGGASISGPTPPSAGGVAAGGGMINQRPPNWKTRLCNKWETTGNCPFGEKCHFAHGTAELQRYGGGPIDSFNLEGGAASQMNSSGNNFGDGDDVLPTYPDTNPQIGNMRQSSGQLQQQATRPSSGMGSKSAAVWKGPTIGISTIYGDWPEDLELTAIQQKYGQPMPLAGQKAVDFSSEPEARKDKDQQNTSPFPKPNNESARIYVQGTKGIIDVGFAELEVVTLSTFFLLNIERNSLIVRGRGVCIQPTLVSSSTLRYALQGRSKYINGLSIGSESRQRRLCW